MHSTTSSATFVFFNDPATTEIYTLSLHDALPFFLRLPRSYDTGLVAVFDDRAGLEAYTVHPEHVAAADFGRGRSEEHTSELQSRQYLVCRLLLEKKNMHLHEFSLQIIHQNKYLLA